MKIILTEEQTNRLTDTILNEQLNFTDFFKRKPETEVPDGEDTLSTSSPMSPTNTDYSSVDVGSGSVNFDELVKLVVNKLEGGYYHPDMLRDGRVKDGRYGKSGETMFGIDRRNGGDLNKTSAGQKFWSLIDGANARSTWKWNSRGGNLEQQLLNLVSQMMSPEYTRLSQRYLSPESQKIVNSDRRLSFNFIYGVWNGSGWFKRFANKINAAVASGIKSPVELNKVAINARINSGNKLIAQSGGKMDSATSSLG